jgi:K+-sensing histidine kinase KdpD
MKFIQDKITHQPEAIISTTTDSTGKTVPIYKWTAGLKAEVLHKLSKANTQSMDPLLQLAKVHQDVWDMALQLGQPHAVKEGTTQVKPLTSITTFHHLTSLSDNEKLCLLTALYNSELNMSELEHQAHHLKVQKQVEAAFATDTHKPIKQCITSLRKECFDREVSVWITPFKKLGKGKTHQPNNFTVCIQELLASMASHNPQVHTSAQQFEWTSPTGFSVKSFLQTLSKKENTPLTSFTSHAFLLLLFQNNLHTRFF